MSELDRLEYLGDRIFGKNSYLTNVRYFDKYRTIGELDIYGFLGDVLCIVEYKSNKSKHSIRKAKRQLRRAEQYAIPIGVPYLLIYAYQKTVEPITFRYRNHLEELNLPILDLSDIPLPK